MGHKKNKGITNNLDSRALVVRITITELIITVIKKDLTKFFSSKLEYDFFMIDITRK